MRKRWQRLRQAKDKAELNRLTNKIHKITRNHRSNAFEKDIMNAMEKDNSVWKIGRRLKSSTKFENRPIHGATGLKYNALDKANAIADCLEDQFRTHEPDDDYLRHYREVRRSVRNFEHTLHQSECLDFTSSETRRVIGELKVNKSAGPDRIPNAAIKELHNQILNHIIKIFNSALKCTIFQLHGSKRR